MPELNLDDCDLFADRIFVQRMWFASWLRAWRVIGRYHYGMHLVESAVDEVP